MRKIMIPQYVAQDGMQFNTPQECAKHEGLHECPKCSGSGSIKKEVDVYPTNLPDSGWTTRIVKQDFPCDLCAGIGYTRDKYEAVTQVTDFKKV